MQGVLWPAQLVRPWVRSELHLSVDNTSFVLGNAELGFSVRAAAAVESS